MDTRIGIVAVKVEQFLGEHITLRGRKRTFPVLPEAENQRASNRIVGFPLQSANHQTGFNPQRSKAMHQVVSQAGIGIMFQYQP